MFERFTSEGRRSLELASAMATERGDVAIGPEHLLAALTDPASGLSAELLAEAGLDEAAVLAAMPAAPGGAGPVTPPFTAASKEALELSLREALNLAHGHIGSGHLLLGLLRLPGADWPKVLLEANGVTLEGTRDLVRQRSEGTRLGGRRRPRRTGRIVEALTPHEKARAGADVEGVVFVRSGDAPRQAGGGVKARNVVMTPGSSAHASPNVSDDELAVRLATEEGSRLQRALASLGVTADELQDALADVAADPLDDGPVELDLGGHAMLAVASGPRAADLRSLLAAADHVITVEGPDGIVRAEAPALGDAVWATLEGWLTA